VTRELIALGPEVYVLAGYPPDKKELNESDRFDDYRFEYIHALPILA